MHYVEFHFEDGSTTGRALAYTTYAAATKAREVWHNLDKGYYTCLTDNAEDLVDPV